jgi:menaquinol-cytochrome c reductase iron-sulfur subunit
METSESSQKDHSRRGFLSLAIAGIGGVMTALIGIPAIAYLVGPALTKQAEDWIQLGSVKKVEPGTPTLFKVTLKHQTGWVTSEEELAAYVLTEDSQNYVALSNICTHLGCRVRWISEQGKFFCPCHNAVFDKDGKVVSGPPPRAMDRFQTKLDNGTLFIKRG